MNLSMYSIYILMKQQQQIKSISKYLIAQENGIERSE